MAAPTSSAAKTDSSDVTEVITEGDKLYDAAKMQEAYDFLLSKADIQHSEVHWRIARVCHDMAKFYTNGDKTRSKELAQLGLTHANKSVALDDKNYLAYEWKGILASCYAEFEGYKVKIEKSYEIRDDFLKACELNPNAALSKHCMGQWCYEVADVPWYMRKAAEYIFATPPTSTYEEALKYFEEAEKLNPGFYCCNWLFIGKCYIKLGKKSEAKPWLEKTVEFNAIFFDEKEAVTEATQLLKRL